MLEDLDGPEPGGGCRLDGVLRAKERITGIVNGVDYGVWNPATDPQITAQYSADKLEGFAIGADDYSEWTWTSVCPNGTGLAAPVVSITEGATMKYVLLLMGNLADQGREISVFKPFDPNGFAPNAPMVWGAQPHKGHVFFSDFNSGLWAAKLEPIR
mgnify:CR=1 FL=1